MNKDEILVLRPLYQMKEYEVIAVRLDIREQLKHGNVITIPFGWDVATKPKDIDIQVGLEKGHTCGDCKWFSADYFHGDFECTNKIAPNRDDVCSSKWPACKFFELGGTCKECIHDPDVCKNSICRDCDHHKYFKRKEAEKPEEESTPWDFIDNSNRSFFDSQGKERLIFCTKCGMSIRCNPMYQYCPYCGKRHYFEKQEDKKEDKDEEIWCTECPYFKDIVDDDRDWFGALCMKDGHESSPSMYAIQSLHDDCPLRQKESEE